jgi:hypothetical protein
MSRPIKQGLDYFPMDIDTDDKIELIEAKHGIAGFGVLVKLFQKIYKEGYYIKWSDETQLLFSKRINVDINSINVIINDCFQYNILSKNLYEQYHILTSTGIQKRYFNATNRRKELYLCEKYVIVDINRINVNINWVNEDGSTQSKVKESKEEKSIVKKSIEKTENFDFLEPIKEKTIDDIDLT